MASSKDSVQRILDRTLRESGIYERVKKDKIHNLKRQLGDVKDNRDRWYEVHATLYEEYKKYQLDSAIYYVQQNIILASQLEDNYKRDKARLILANLFSTMGKFIESKKLLDEISNSPLNESLLADYYRVQSSFHSHYGLSSNNPHFFKVSEQYRDSLLDVLDTLSLEYRISYVTKQVYAHNYDAAGSMLHNLVDELDESDEDRAFVAYLLGVIYGNVGKKDLQIKYLGISAIGDIKNVIKDNASMQSLAMAYYEDGDIDRANVFIEKAISDAVFSNVRFRTIESSSFYPIIHTAFVKKEKEQQSELLKFLIIISILSVLLLIGVIYIYWQMSKLRKARVALDRINHQLVELNQQLLFSNEQLKESNHVKEEYIAQFFDICSTYINKLDVMRKDILKKILNQSYDNLKKELQSGDYLKAELEDLYHNFDVIFINLYPTFVSEFNDLLLPEEQIVLKEGEVLNSELRIFALVRLGISDNAKIASFLRYSLRTVYNYRVKTRSKMKGAKTDFEKSIMNIGNS